MTARTAIIARATNWVGHRWWLAVTLLLVPVALPRDQSPPDRFLGVIEVHHHNPVWVSIISLLGSIGTVVWCYASVKHDAGLCEECMAAMPLNSSELAERKRRLLWFYHRASWPTLILATLIGFVAPTIILGTFVIAWQAVSGAVFAAAFALVNYAKVRHGQLQPWCPWCGDDGDDDDEYEDVPDDPSGLAIDQPHHSVR